jgi:hypothetical protein
MTSPVLLFAPADMRYITRVDSARAHGYRVRVQRRGQPGEKPTVVCQFFSDGVRGGPERAYAAAIVFRNAAVAAAPKALHAQRQPAGIQNGYGYVKKGKIRRKREGKVTLVEQYEGWYRSRAGKVLRKRFTVDKWGRKSKALADAWLAETTAADYARVSP